MEFQGERRSDQCCYYLFQKKRFCRMKAVKVNGYCAEHILKDRNYVDSTNDGGRASVRIPCPLDPSHTVYDHLLHKHLKKCNAAKKPVLDCYSKGINSGQVSYVPSDKEKLSLCEYDQAMIDEVLKKVDAAYQILYEDIKEEYGSHPLLEKEISDNVNGPAACKHLIQQSSIINHLEGLHLLTNNTCYLEFGAGRGALSHWVQQATNHTDDVHYVLIDRASCRRKMDVKHRHENQGPRFERLLIDIEDLELRKLACLSSGECNKMVAISKHLCGEATDLALRCLSNYHQDCLPRDSTSCDRSRNQQAILKGIVIALCCHQRCKWKSFFGYEILSGLGFTPVDFHIIAHTSSWAVCGTRSMTTDGIQPTTTTDGVLPTATTDGLLPMTTKDGVQPMATADGVLPTATTDQVLPMTSTDGVRPTTTTDRVLPADGSDDLRGGYRPHPKENVGLKCKRLLDMCRVHALRQLGYNVRLVHYTHRYVSLENVLLIATT